MRIMLKRKEATNNSSEKWPVPTRLRLISILIFFCWISTAIGACGVINNTSANTSATPSPAQSSIVARPLHTTEQTLDGDFSITLDITPNQPGINAFTAHIINNHTNEVTTDIELTLYITMQDMYMGTDSVVLHANKNGQFSATSNILNMSGHWAIGIAIQTTDHVIHKAGVTALVALKT